MTEDHIEKNEGDSLRVYEVGYLLLPSIPEEHVSQNTDAIKKMIADVSGNIISQGDPQLRNLSYEMVKNVGSKNQTFKSAYFGWIKFEAPAESIPTLHDNLRATENILRFLLIKTVRENTFMGLSKNSAEEKGSGEESSEETSPSESSQEEIDKSIEELVTEE